MAADAINNLDSSKYQDVILKAKNNRAWNLLKKERQKRRNGKHITELEKAKVLKLKGEIWGFLCGEKVWPGLDITSYHLKAWEHTCKEIEKTFKSEPPNAP